MLGNAHEPQEQWNMNSPQVNEGDDSSIGQQLDDQEDAISIQYQPQNALIPRCKATEEQQDYDHTDHIKQQNEEYDQCELTMKIISEVIEKHLFDNQSEYLNEVKEEKIFDFPQQDDFKNRPDTRGKQHIQAQQCNPTATISEQPKTQQQEIIGEQKKLSKEGQSNNQQTLDNLQKQQISIEVQTESEIKIESLKNKKGKNEIAEIQKQSGQKLPKNRFKNVGNMIVRKIGQSNDKEMKNYVRVYDEEYKKNKIQKWKNVGKEQDGKKIQINHGKKFLQHIATKFPVFLKKILEEKAFQYLRNSSLLFRKTKYGNGGKPSQEKCEQYQPLFDYLISYRSCECCKGKKKVKLT